jgi:murein DD-endopeptidase MepM/ murein hydrolase activator NlpD
MRYTDPDGMWPWTQLIKDKKVNQEDIKGGSNFGMRTHPIKKVEQMHKGIDIGDASDDGKGIQAAAKGKVLAIGYEKDGAGNFIFIDNGKGYVSKYMHMKDASNLKVGGNVDNGDIIGKVGSTGASTASHLHFQIEKNGQPIDPTELKTDPVRLNGKIVSDGFKTDDLNVAINGLPMGQNQTTLNQGKNPSFSEKMSESSVPIVSTFGQILKRIGL